MNIKQALLRHSNKILSVAVLAVLIIVPVVMVLLRSFMIDAEFQLLAPVRTIVEGDLGEVFVNSIRLAVTVVIVTTVIAGPLAFLTGKTELARAKWIDVALLVPFMTPPYIATMGWILFMQPRGVVDQYLPFLGAFRPLFFSFWGIVMVMSFNLFPFIYLVIKNTLMEITRSLEDAGAVHGGTFLYRMRRVILPLVFSGYTMGALLIFVVPPSVEELQARLHARSTESPEALARRMRNAETELARQDEYDHVVVNETGQVERTAVTIDEMIAAEHARHPDRRLRV